MWFLKEPVLLYRGGPLQVEHVLELWPGCLHSVVSWQEEDGVETNWGAEFLWVSWEMAEMVVLDALATDWLGYTWEGIGKDTKKRTDDTTEEPHDLLKEGATFDDPDELPDVITPAGLSAQRQWYLYEKIREFCPVTDRDCTIPG